MHIETRYSFYFVKSQEPQRIFKIMDKFFYKKSGTFDDFFLAWSSS